MAKLTTTQSAKFVGTTDSAIRKRADRGGLPFTTAPDGSRLFDVEDLKAQVWKRARVPTEAAQQEILKRAELAAESRSRTYVDAPRALTRVAPRYVEGVLEEPLSLAERRREVEEKNRATAEAWLQTHYALREAAFALGMRPPAFRQFAGNGRFRECNPPSAREVNAHGIEVVAGPMPALKSETWYLRSAVDKKAAELEEGRRELLKMQGAPANTPVPPSVIQEFLDLFESVPNGAIGIDEEARAKIVAAFGLADKVGGKLLPSVPGTLTRLVPGTFAPMSPEEHDAYVARQADSWKGTSDVFARVQARRRAQRAIDDKAPNPFASWMPEEGSRRSALDESESEAGSRPCKRCGKGLPEGKSMCPRCGAWTFDETG